MNEHLKNVIFNHVRWQTESEMPRLESHIAELEEQLKEAKKDLSKCQQIIDAGCKEFGFELERVGFAENGPYKVIKR